MNDHFSFRITIMILLTHSALGASYKSCLEDSALYEARSEELKKLAEEDQADRPGNRLKANANFRDRKRRQRVGAIFGEGCFRSAEDYYSAATVFLHGDDLKIDGDSRKVQTAATDQFFVGFYWAKRAADLGHPDSSLAAKSIDRFLFESNHRQLFGTQFFKVNSDPCWCQVPVEGSFPDDQRVAYLGKKLEIYTAETLKRLPGQGASCGVKTCDIKLSDSPKGTVLGFW
jgi:hypothetical protein